MCRPRRAKALQNRADDDEAGNRDDAEPERDPDAAVVWVDRDRAKHGETG